MHAPFTFALIITAQRAIDAVGAGASAVLYYMLGHVGHGYHRDAELSAESIRDTQADEQNEGLQMAGAQAARGCHFACAALPHGLVCRLVVLRHTIRGTALATLISVICVTSYLYYRYLYSHYLLIIHLISARSLRQLDVLLKIG